MPSFSRATGREQHLTDWRFIFLIFYIRALVLLCTFVFVLLLLLRCHVPYLQSFMAQFTVHQMNTTQHNTQSGVGGVPAHTYTNTARTRMHVHTQTYTLTKQTQAHTHTWTQQTYTRRHTHTNAHTHMHRKQTYRTNARTHTHTHFSSHGWTIKCDHISAKPASPVNTHINHVYTPTFWYLTLKYCTIMYNVFDILSK